VSSALSERESIKKKSRKLKFEEVKESIVIEPELKFKSIEI